MGNSSMTGVSRRSLLRGKGHRLKTTHDLMSPWRLQASYLYQVDVGASSADKRDLELRTGWHVSARGETPEKGAYASAAQLLRWDKYPSLWILTPRTAGRNLDLLRDPQTMEKIRVRISQSCLLRLLALWRLLVWKDRNAGQRGAVYLASKLPIREVHHKPRTALNRQTHISSARKLRCATKRRTTAGVG